MKGCGTFESRPELYRMAYQDWIDQFLKHYKPTGFCGIACDWMERDFSGLKKA